MKSDPAKEDVCPVGKDWTRDKHNRSHNTTKKLPPGTPTTPCTASVRYKHIISPCFENLCRCCSSIQLCCQYTFYIPYKRFLACITTCRTPHQLCHKVTTSRLGLFRLLLIRLRYLNKPEPRPIFVIGDYFVPTAATPAF